MKGSRKGKKTNLSGLESPWINLTKRLEKAIEKMISKLPFFILHYLCPELPVMMFNDEAMIIQSKTRHLDHVCETMWQGFQRLN